MITRGYLTNIYNKSEVTCMPYKDKYMNMICELPNGTIISVGTRIIKQDIKVAIDICKEKVLDEIARYERYVQADKTKYGYDLNDEYFEEYGEGGELHG